MGTRLRPEGTMPWMPGFRYGALLPPLALNLLVRDTERAAAFYRDVLDAEVHYRDIDFAAVRVGPAEVMLHADHTHDEHPWSADLAEGATRGVGAQLRLLGIDPDAVEARAREHGAQLVAPATDKGHGWRETLVRDPDGLRVGGRRADRARQGTVRAARGRCVVTEEQRAIRAALYPSLAGKRAVIIGGSRGIGRAISLRLAAEGCHVLVNYARSTEAAEQTAAECRARGVEAEALRADAGNREEARPRCSRASRSGAASTCW